eukprot:TRINITY_DN3374_c0_g1_i1.p1 TRINITY_DN3374_c0_g1~~TRINITY_DN3374_c0_g1_i1.p1  ORF type:complete len:341 (-),score=67.43 TRINITY_DN3374_c0_g1_i1:52-1074(-)
MSFFRFSRGLASLPQIITRREIRKGKGLTYEPKLAHGQVEPPKLPKRDPTTGWNTKSRRVGAIAVKLGMTQDWNEFGEFVPLTVVRMADNIVTQLKTTEKEGYEAIQIGGGNQKLKRLTKPLKGHFAKHDLDPKKELVEFKITADARLLPGTKILANHFVAGQKIDVSGITIGKGTQGAMRRWGFRGQPATHGVSLTHRSLGATGNRQNPGKVFKNKKMAARMGNCKRTVMNVLVHKIDTEQQLLYLKGQIPGPAGKFVHIRDAYKYEFEMIPPFPTYIPKEGVEVPNITVAKYKPSMIGAESSENRMENERQYRKKAFEESSLERLRDALQRLKTNKDR